MTKPKSIPSVSVNYACNGSSTKANEMGMRVMQERAYEKRGEQYLLIKSPPASGKSRALMFIALDKLHNQGLKKAIIVVPEKSIGSSFNNEPLSKYGFWADWEVAPQWNLCNAPGDDNGGKIGSVKAFLDSSDRILVCTHATFRFAVERFGIRIQKVVIQEFRGIRNLTFELKGENFAVCGPNGTGKSGIVDAVEFALTGNISRLSGEGTGDLSVAKHGPHVDSREKPDQAYVELTFVIVSSGKQATIQRTIKNATKPKITPSDDDIKAVLAHIEEHPEFVLSRRELIRYVISKPGDRSKEVQALLKLDKLETLRTLFQKIWNACKNELKPFASNKKFAQDVDVLAQATCPRPPVPIQPAQELYH